MCTVYDWTEDPTTGTHQLTQVLDFQLENQVCVLSS